MRQCIVGNTTVPVRSLRLSNLGPWLALGWGTFHVLKWMLYSKKYSKALGAKTQDRKQYVLILLINQFRSQADGVLIEVIDYFLALFPVFTLSTNFPIIAITLRLDTIGVKPRWHCSVSLCRSSVNNFRLLQLNKF